MIRAALAVVVVVGLMLVVNVSDACAGAVEVLTQSRDVAASTNVELNGVTDTQSDSKEAPDAGLFNGVATADASATDAGQTIIGAASATQDSELLPFRFSFVGQLTAGGSLSSVDGVNTFDFGASTSTSALIGFRLDERMTLTPTMDVNGNFQATKDNSSFSFEVVQDGGTVADFRSNAPIDLDAGDYTLSFNYAFGPSSSSDFENKSSQYVIAIDFSPSGGVAIPLPPGILLGGMTLAMAGALRIARGITRFAHRGL
ncbi:MAG: hypothetical protein QOF78_33 [Phycisphaerales bacterium]|jgi:hypothetical protein|nr:hypothetical protein [Phycisphaerales bacterium]